MEKTDPWEDRNKGLVCESCIWFIFKMPRSGATTVGRCRRYAPTMIGYPVVFTTDWCGDHKLDENKV